jgi:hypothetical protein
VQRLDAVAVAVYLLGDDGSELWAAMIGGSPPSVFTLPGRMAVDGPCASARALASGRVVILTDPDWIADPENLTPETGLELQPSPYDLPYPYSVTAAPVATAGRRFGALAVLRLQTQRGQGGADRAVLREQATNWPRGWPC